MQCSAVPHFHVQRNRREVYSRGQFLSAERDALIFPILEESHLIRQWILIIEKEIAADNISWSKSIAITVIPVAAVHFGPYVTIQMNASKSQSMRSLNCEL